MPHMIAPLPFKPSRLNGLSERLLASHYENNYGGAVRRLSAIESELANLDWEAAPGFLINGLRREALIAANSMILHEAYFEALGGTGDGPPSELAAALERDFGSVDRWRREFVAMGKALGGGSGWALLAWSPRLGRLVNQWAADHAHALADGHVVLALDMYEHAYHLDFGARAAAYVDAFMRNIDWERTAQRSRAARSAAPARTEAEDDASVSPEELRGELASREPPLVLDVRLAKDRAASGERLRGGEMRDPASAAQWASALPPGRRVVAYCVYGFQVSRDVVAALRERGVDARCLRGGLSAWKAVGGAVEAVE
jgi:Fe-Mn family superoxide dismutase